MKKVGLVLALVLVVAFTACGKKDSSTSSSSATGDAAVVGSTTITMAELNDAAKSQLQKIDTQIYQIKKKILDDLIETKLVEQAAKAAGKSVDDFINQEVTSKIQAPTEDEIKALYEARKDQIKESFEQIKGQIANYLAQNRLMQARSDLIARLKKDTKITIDLNPPRVKIDAGDAPYLGEKNGSVTLIEFSDYQCPFCKRVRPTISKLLEDYKGKITYVFLDNPLVFHKEARKAHEAARCAGAQDKYYDYSKKLFDNQSDLAVDSLKKYAKELQLNTDKFDKCLDSGEMAPIVEANLAKGGAVGVTGTPAYFINGIMLSGAQPYDAFKQIIDSELAK